MSDSVLLSEIAEQPSVLERLLTGAAPEVEEVAATVRARNIHHLIIAARGSSDNAARYAQDLFGAHNRLTVTLATPSLFTRYGTPPLHDRRVRHRQLAVRPVARPHRGGGGGAAAGLPDAGHHQRGGIPADGFVDDVDLEARAGGRVLAGLAQLANLLDAVIAGAVNLQNIQGPALGDLLAARILVVKIDLGAAGAVEALGENARDGGLARAARPAEEIGVSDALLLDGVRQGLGDMFLAHHLAETLRAVLASYYLIRHCAVGQDLPAEPRTAVVGPPLMPAESFSSGPGRVFKEARVTTADAEQTTVAAFRPWRGSWIKPQTISGGDSVVLGKFWNPTMTSPYYQYGLELTGGTVPNLFIGTAGGPLSASMGSALALDQWSYLAVVFDGSQVRYYVNGVLVTTVSLTATITGRNNGFQVGADSNIQQFFRGSLDELRIYNRALTVQEVLTDMNSAG